MSTIFDTLVTDAMRRAFDAASEVTAKYTDSESDPGIPGEPPLGPYFLFEIEIDDEEGTLDVQDPTHLPEIQVTCKSIHCSGEQVRQTYPMTHPQATYRAEFENLVELVKRKQVSDPGPGTKVA